MERGGGTLELVEGGKRYVLRYRCTYEPDRGRSGLDTYISYNLRDRETNELLISNGSAWGVEDTVEEAARNDARRRLAL